MSEEQIRQVKERFYQLVNHKLGDISINRLSGGEKQ